MHALECYNNRNIRIAPILGEDTGFSLVIEPLSEYPVFKFVINVNLSDEKSSDFAFPWNSELFKYGKKSIVPRSQTQNEEFERNHI